jgi:pimeloyl-ACP methyl ester carboxylesterase
MKSMLKKTDIHQANLKQSNNSIVNSVCQGVGAPVLMVHGLAASLHDWDDLISPLAQSGYAGYALDLLGHGDSIKPDGVHDYSFDSVFDHMLGWIDSLSLTGPAILIGHSLGGGLALRYAMRYPERVRGLVLINPFYDIKQLPPIMRTVFRRQLLNTNLIDKTPYWLFRFMIDLSSFNIHIGQRETHMLPEHVRYQTALDYTRASSGIYNIPRAHLSWTSDLERVTQPTLILWGAHDQTLDTKSFSRLVDMLPNARGHSFRMCGHVPHQCHPEQLNPLVFEFLNSLG